jgi:hypothetical protein
VQHLTVESVLLVLLSLEVLLALLLGDLILKSSGVGLLVLRSDSATFFLSSLVSVPGPRKKPPLEPTDRLSGLALARPPTAPFWRYGVLPWPPGPPKAGR